MGTGSIGHDARRIAFAPNVTENMAILMPPALGERRGEHGPPRLSENQFKARPNCVLIPFRSLLYGWYHGEFDFWGVPVKEPLSLHLCFIVVWATRGMKK